MDIKKAYETPSVEFHAIVQDIIMCSGNQNNGNNGNNGNGNNNGNNGNGGNGNHYGWPGN